MENNFFNEVVTENALNERFDKILLQDAEYIALQKKIDVASDNFDALNLSKEYKQVIDSLIAAYTQLGAYFGKATYKQGFRDCANLFQNLYSDE